MEFDFGGYATKNDLVCSDGRTIKKNAFKSQNGQKVPLVWMHQRNDPNNVLGHAYLENRDDGVYAYCKFNASPNGKHAKLLVEHGDVSCLSIFANDLVQKGGNVTHGAIREVSLVIAGANPGAVIDNPIVQHSDGEEYEDLTRATICCGMDLCFDDVEFNIEHDDTKSRKKKVKMEDPDDEDDEDLDDEDPDDEDEDEEDDDMEDDPKKTVKHAATDSKKERTVQDVYDEMTEEQQSVVAYIVGLALANEAEEEEEEDDAAGKKSSAQHDIEGGDPMKKNAFDQNAETPVSATLTHDMFASIVEDARKCGSMREAVKSFIEHASSDSAAAKATYGIENIEVLFSDAKAVTTDPALIKRDTEWVAGVLADTRHVPFTRVKSTAADLTADEARAKGYVKGNLKKEEVIRLLKRVTGPTTVYKKQKLDKDDIDDIDDIDVVAFLKREMRVMLNEELARAYLVGDGRDVEDEDKINEECIRPIAHDDDMYAHKVILADTTPAGMVEGIIRSRKFYKGSGSPAFYTTTDALVDMLLQKDTLGRRIYNSETELTAALRVNKIVEVPVMEDVEVEIDSTKYDLVGIVVNLRDYTVGAKNGGNLFMFDDFDIDYNQYKYLLETRQSGALTIPKSALVIVKAKATTPGSGTGSGSGGTQTQSVKANSAKA